MAMWLQRGALLVARNALGTEDREDLLGCHELLLQRVSTPGIVELLCLCRKGERYL